MDRLRPRGSGSQSARRCAASERDLSSLYKRTGRKGELYGFEAHERFYEIGRPESYAETDAFLRRVGTSRLP